MIIKTLVQMAVIGAVIFYLYKKGLIEYLEVQLDKFTKDNAKRKKERAKRNKFLSKMFRGNNEI